MAAEGEAGEQCTPTTDLRFKMTVEHNILRSLCSMRRWQYWKALSLRRSFGGIRRPVDDVTETMETTDPSISDLSSVTRRIRIWGHYKWPHGFARLPRQRVHWNKRARIRRGVCNYIERKYRSCLPMLIWGKFKLWSYELCVAEEKWERDGLMGPSQ